MNVDLYGNPCERKVSGPICGPFKGVLFGLKGDQKYLQRALKLKTSWVSESCCMYCGATSSGPLVYTSFGEHAPHRATLQTTDGFMTRGCDPNAWLRIPGFSLSMVLTDWLHLVDLALTPEVSASVAHTNWKIMALCFSCWYIRWFANSQISIVLPLPRLWWNSRRHARCGTLTRRMRGCVWRLWISQGNAKSIESASRLQSSASCWGQISPLRHFHNMTRKPGPNVQYAPWLANCVFWKLIEIH